MKKRTLAVILLGLFLTSLTFPLFSTTVFASPDPTTIGTSTTALAVGFPDQHKGFYANGRHWVFYVNGTHMVYKTSADDGSSWNNFTVIRSGVVSGRDFSIYFDGTYVHYVFANFTLDVAIYYRRGTPNLDGSITWSDDEQIAVPSSASDQYLALIATDSNGYPFISYKDNDYPYVTKSSLNNGTWQTASGFPHQLTSTSGTTWRSVIIPLTSGKMYAYYLKTGPAPQLIYGQLWNGTNWGSEETVSQWTPSSNYMVSAVNYGDDIHLVYCNVTSRDILYTKRTYGSGWSADETIQTSAQAPALSLVSGTGDLYCFWMDAPTADHVYYKKYDQATGVWDESPTDWFTETEGLANDEYQSSYYEDYGERIGFLYTSSSPSPYNVRFTYISTSNTSPTMGEFEAPSSVYAGTTYAFNATVVDSDGRSTLNNCSLALDFGSMKFNWFEVDNSTTITDPSNYATLDSSSVAVVNATAYKITWNVSFFSNVTEGYVSLTTGTIVYDDSDATGTNTESNWFYLYPYGTTAIYLSISPQDINTKVDTYFTLTGRLYTLSGSTTTGIPDKTVYLQYTPDIKAPWSNVTSTTTDSNGVVSFLHSESQWGTYYYRLKFFGDDTYASATSSTCTAVISSGGSSEGGIGVDSDSPFEVIDVDFGGDYGDWVDVEIDPDNPIEGTFQPDGTWHADIPYTVNVPEGTEEGEYEIPYTVRIRDPNTGTITDLQGTMKILVQAIPEVTMWIFGFIIFLILIGGLIVNKRRNRHEY